MIRKFDILSPEFVKSCIKLCNFSAYGDIGEGVTEMKKPKFISLFIDLYDELEMVSDAQAGQLIKALLRYASCSAKPDFGGDTALCILFSMMKKQIDRDFEKYEEIREKKSAAGKRGGAPTGNANAKKTNKSSKTSDDNDYDKDNDNDNDKDEDDLKSPFGDPARESPALFLPEVNEVIEYLNEKAGTRYRASAVGTRRCIAALLDEGYTTDDMKRVVNVKCAEWLNSEFSRYLRPDILFGKKFEGYLNAPAPKKALPKSKLHPWQNQTQDSFAEVMQCFESAYEVPACEAKPA